MKHTAKHYTIPIFVPELACPFQCVFCNQQKISGQQHIPDESEIINTIESHLGSFKEGNRRVEIGFFGGSFTGISQASQQKYLSLAQPYIATGDIQSIRLSTRPDYINTEILDFLKQYHVETIELGAQSMDDRVLKASRRGHTAAQTAEAAALIQSKGFKLGLQMMIGLPGDSLESSLETARQIIALKADNTRIYPAVVIRYTIMHQWFEKGRYEPLKLEDAVAWTKQIIPLFELAGVKVIRVGLHPSEDLVSGKELVAGPLHPSFRELVETEIWADLLEPLLHLNEKNSLNIQVPKKEINYAIGYKGRNKKRLLEKFSAVHIHPLEGLSRRSYKYDFHPRGSH